MMAEGEKKRWCTRKAFACVVVLSSALCVPLLGFILEFYSNYLFFNVEIPGSVEEGEALELRFLFDIHDKNKDGVISLDEFRDVADKLKDVGISYTYEVEPEDGDQELEVHPFFQPLLLSSMKTEEDGWTRQDIFNTNGLRAWDKPVVHKRVFTASQFKPFLPKHQADITNHQVYYVVKPADTSSKGLALPSDRFFPMKMIRPEEILAHRLLSMFHSRPFVYMRFAPQGTVACVRAYNGKYLDIMFRMHAEFQLNEPPHRPFWFTPSQFTGHIIMDKSSSEIRSFHLYVPNKNKLNVDMEWFKTEDEDDDDNLQVDIGYMPQMELRYIPFLSTYNDLSDEDSDRVDDMHNNSAFADDIDNIKWTHELDEETVLRQLETKLYPFKEVKYHNFTSIFAEAERLNRPIHSILLWGALDDQSC